MDTDDNSEGTLNAFTVPDAIAKLEVEDQAMFRRVFSGLFDPGNTQEQIGPYELREKIAAGGMGVVYRAFDPKLERSLAIKLVAPRPGRRDAELLRERLLREAQALARLEHPNVVGVHEFGVDSGRVFLVMELIDGPTLRERQHCASPRERVQLYLAAGQGLSAAHDAGIVHRDFKPDNVFIDAGDGVHVGDFGLARLVGEVEQEQEQEQEQGSRLAETVALRLTRSGEIQGTLGYMAPEQLLGQESGPAADQFAFCVSLWESLCGQLPFAGMTPAVCLEAMEGAPRGELPSRMRRVRRVLLKGLARRPGDRYSSMAELLGALMREYQRPKRMVQVAAAILTVATLLGLLAYGWVQRTDLEQLQAEQEAELMAEQARERARCADVGALADPREHANWEKLKALAGPSLEGRVEVLMKDARDACTTGDEPALLEHALGLVASLNERLDEPSRFSSLVMDFNTAYEDPSSRPLSPHVSAWLRKQPRPLLGKPEELERIETTLSCVLDDCARAPITLESALDRGELYLRRGKVRALRGNNEAALEDYREAYSHAREGNDEARELRALTQLAKTSIMRANRFEAGGEFIGFARAIPSRVGPLGAASEKASLRELALRELEAVLASHEGEFERALEIQRSIVEALDPENNKYERVAALTNLANIHARTGATEDAERLYHEALALDPQGPEASLNLGRLLAASEDPERVAEARRLLGKLAKLAGHELQRSSLILLLELDLNSEQAELAALHRLELEQLLASEVPPPTYKQRFDGWMLVAFAYASSAEFGPRLDVALAQIPEPKGLEFSVQHAGGMLQIASYASDVNSDRASELLTRARAELEALDEADIPGGYLAFLSDLEKYP